MIKMAKYPMTINLSQELIERLRKEKEDNPKFRASHLIEDLLKDHFNRLTFSLSNLAKSSEEDYLAEQDSINSDLEKELKAWY